MDTIFHTRLYLNASECNAQRQISLPLLVQRLIETATDHAQQLKVGYEDLRANSLSWVLSRLTLEMISFPTVNTTYCIDTWVESINRHFTERCFKITDGDGVALGYVRTVWFAMNMYTRTGGDLTQMMSHVETVNVECPIKSQGKIKPVMSPDMVRHHRFMYSDIDFNRHVNSTRYIEALLNGRSVEFYDSNIITRFEIAYMDEVHQDEQVEISRESIPGVDTYEIKYEGRPMTRARLTYREH